MKRLGVFTSGGDSPGMNAAIRAIVRTAMHHKLEVFGIYDGYEGMIDNSIERLDHKSVANIIQKGGTFLRSSRSARFMTEQGRNKAYANLKENGIEGLVAIGGDGTFKGALEFSKEHKISVIGLPGTIDNDLLGTDYTIGYDTCLNTIVEAVDKIRDTATSHNRLFVVEVMGKDAGFIALRSGIASGAEAVLFPETKTYMDQLLNKLEIGRRKSKTSGIIIVAEGDDSGGAYVVSEEIKKKFPHFDVRVTILGHIQRGGSPSAYDRVLASRLGFGAVQALLEGKRNVMLGILNGNYAYTSFEKSLKHHQKINPYLLNLIEILSS